MTESSSHGVKVTGLADLEARIKRMAPAAIIAVKDANNQNALEFMQKIAAVIPIRTGALLRSMKKQDVGPIGVKVEIGDTHPYYLNYVEYGHRTKEGKHVPPDPFWWPTWRLNKKRFRRRTARAGNAALKKAAAGEHS